MPRFPVTGTAVTKILAPVSRFSVDGGHGQKKQRVLSRQTELPSPLRLQILVARIHAIRRKLCNADEVVEIELCDGAAHGQPTMPAVSWPPVVPYSPLSQTITSPPPYSPWGIVPSKVL